MEEIEYKAKRFDNLKKSFDKMTNKILGEDYYNYGCDTYSCDTFTCEDLMYTFLVQKKTINVQRLFIVVSFIVNVVLGVIIWKN